MRQRHSEAESLFTTMGTIALYVAASGFSWFWLKGKLRSPSLLVRQARKLFYAAHKWLGWTALALGAAHGTYLLCARIDDNHIYSGLASLVILLIIVAYGLYIHKIRNKWMRRIHRSLGMLWVPVLFVHAGGSALAAASVVIGVGVLTWLLEKYAKRRQSQS